MCRSLNRRNIVRQQQGKQDIGKICNDQNEESILNDHEIWKSRQRFV